jgi:DNA helicase II / ATP-dependent DNA helicase PcrA
MAWDEDINPESPAYAIAASTAARIGVLAGPGTGKSFAMKRQVARLLEEDVQPVKILPVTFTRVAAEDLHRELQTLQAKGAAELHGRTLHSLAMTILTRQHVLEALGRTARPLNEYEMEPLLEDLNAAHGNKHKRAKLVEAYVAAWARLQHEEPGQAANADDQAFANDLVSWLRFHEAMLIGEVIPQLHQYLKLNPGAAERSEFSHILIDEFQDLNKAEQEVLRLLGETANICIVGDDDQSIYRFKHAHPAGIRTWAEQNEAEDHAIDICRRCPTRVVAIANSLIQHNVDRQPRQLVGREENGIGEVRIRQFLTASHEAAGGANKIISLIQGGVSRGEIIVLAQRSTFATPIYEALRDAGIAVKSYYAESELGSAVAQERFAILKLFLDAEDRVALRWLLGFGHQRWHAKQYKRIRDHAEQTGESPRQILEQLSGGGLTIAHVQTLVERFEQLQAEISMLTAAPDLHEFVATWLPESPDTILLQDAVDKCLPESASVKDLYDLCTRASPSRKCHWRSTRYG